MLALKSVPQGLCSMPLLSLLPTLLLFTPLTCPLVRAVPANSIVPPVYTSFFSTDRLTTDASTIRSHLRHFSLDPTVTPYPIPLSFQLASADRVRNILHDHRLSQNLLHLESVADRHRYAFVLPSAEESVVVGGGGGLANSAKMALITVHRVGGGGVELNGFVRVEGIRTRNWLQHWITAADGRPGERGPFSHALEPLLRGQIRGF